MRSPTAKVKGPTPKLSGEGGNVTTAPQKREAPTRSKPGSNQPPNRRSPSNGAPGRLPGQPESPSNGSKVSKGEKVVKPMVSPKEVPKITGELKGLREKKLSQSDRAQQDRFSQSQVDPPDTGRSIGIASIASESSIHSLRPGGRARSEPPLPKSLGHLGIPSKSPRSSPMPQGREAANSTVFEWEQAQSRRAALYSEIPDRGRSYQDSSAVNALVFGQRRTRPGSVDPGLSEDRIRPGSLMEQPAGMPASGGSREGLRRLQRSVTPQPSNGVLMGDSTMGRSCSEKPGKQRRRSVPRISPGDAGTLCEVVFGSSTMKAPPHPEVFRQVWGGCAGQPSTRAEGGRKAPQFSTLADLKGYAGLVSSTCTLTSSLPGSPLSDTSSVVEPTRRSGIRLIHDAPGASDNYQIQEASPHWPVEQKPKGDAGDDRLNTYRSLYAGAAGRSSWMGSVSRRQHHCPETSSRGNASDQSNDLQGSSPLLQESAHGTSLSGSNRSRMRRQFPSKPTTQASLISLSHDPETGRKIQEEAEAWNRLFEQSAGRLTHREERRGVKSVPSSVASTKDLLTPSPQPLPSPRPRPTLEEGGGAPWDRRDSAALNARGAQIKESSSV